MKLKLFIPTVVVMMLFLFGMAWAGESATPEECMRKCYEAAEFLSQAGEAGLEEFKDPKGRWVWKDTYIFVLDCDRRITVAHIVPQVVGKPINILTDPKGNPFGEMICDAGSKPKGGWIEYWWPRKGEALPSRKISFCYHAEGTPYKFGAGIYEPTATLEELNAMVK